MANRLAHPRLSFLDLPREIRDQIYGYCTLQKVDEWPPEYTGNPPPLGPMGLLRVCKTIHTEAALVFYGNHLHVFYIGWRHTWHNSTHTLSYDLYSDATTHVAPRYLPMIKSCVLFVNPAMWGCSSLIKSTFLKIKGSVQAFADHLSGGRSLREFQVVYTTGGYVDDFPLFVPSPASDPGHHGHEWQYTTDTRLHLLEPLTDLYGIPRVSVAGVNYAYANRLERAMSCSQKAVSPYQETYKTRMVKVKGQRGVKKSQNYRTSKYYESKILWREDLLGPLPPLPEMPAYK